MGGEIANLLQQVLSAGTGPLSDSTQDQFHQVAQSTQPDELSQGISAAFNSGQTASFGEMIATMFGQANPQQKSGIVNRLLAGLGPAAAGVLAQIGLSHGQNTATPTLSIDQAAQVSPAQVQQIATHAQNANPGIVESMSNFYAQHPVLVKSLGAAALAIILRQIGNRQR